MKKVPKLVICIITLICVSLIALFIYKSQKHDDNSTSSIYPTNKNGQTYGSAVDAPSVNDYPDLILAVGDDNITEGYVTLADFLGNNKDEYEHYKKEITDKALLEHYQNEYRDMYENYKDLSFYQVCYDIPLYDETGENIIGKKVRVIEIIPVQ